MKATELAALTLGQARDLLAARALSAVELMEASLEQIARTEPSVHAYVARLTRKEALDAAKSADKTLARKGAHGSLTAYRSR